MGECRSRAGLGAGRRGVIPGLQRQWTLGGGLCFVEGWTLCFLDFVAD